MRDRRAGSGAATALHLAADGTITACTDRDVARQLPAYLSIGGRTLARFEEQRAYLFGAGIPAAFGPSASELGRTDLT